MQMMRGAVLLATSLGLLEPTHAQEITLACSGTYTSYQPPVPESSISGLSILLNLRTGKVRTLLGDMTVTKDGSDEIVSSQPLVEEGRVTGKTITSINRITGQTSILRVRDPNQNPVFHYQLTCRPARRMF